MSPEQQFTTAYLAPASDIYSLGITLFEMLTGRAYKNLKHGTRLAAVRWAAPAWLDELAGRMLAKEPDGRPWDGGETAELLAAGWRAECEGRELIVKLTPDLPLTLLRVPAGEFLMGSTDADTLAYADEKPQHRLSLPSYWIGKTPVTVAQFTAFVKATGYQTTAEQAGSGWTHTGSEWQDVKDADWAHPRGPGSDVQGKASHPVTLVSWYDAVAFCQWVSQMTGWQVRLPSEVEWEKAASWKEVDKETGKQRDRGRKLVYPWGNEPSTEKLCNFNMNVRDTTPVGRYSPAGDSPYGCADMAGNVGEWTGSLWGKDWEKPHFGYPYFAGDGREDLAAGADVRRVSRGGSFDYVASAKTS
jgi:formylglycine-generating enzyme required for sulfatase activity